MRRLFFLFIAIWLAGISSVVLRAQSTFDADAWTTVPVEDAVCAFGQPYQFFARSADPTRLLIYFQGGGACWNAATCTADGPFDSSVMSVMDEIGTYEGIFDFTHPDNPVADHSVVVVPYCTADVHTGAASVPFNGAEVQFNGYANAAAALSWAYETFPAAEQVVVTGSSAGAYGAAHHATAIFDQYPAADQVLLGDAGIGVTSPGWEGLITWGTYTTVPDDPAFATIAEDPNFTSGLYTRTAALHPSARLAQFTTYADGVQINFFAFQGGNFFGWIGGMRDSLDALGDDLPAFRSYIAWGDEHVILPRPSFYTTQVNGVRFRDWFAGLLAGDPIDNVVCDECTEEELYTP